MRGVHCTQRQLPLFSFPLLISFVDHDRGLGYNLFAEPETVAHEARVDFLWLLCSQEIFTPR